jgi:hypothetical protein
MLQKHYKRTPKGYDGAQTTTHQLQDLLTFAVSKIGTVYKDRPDLVLAAWPEIIGPKFASLTKAVSFDEGILAIKVKNSSLLSLLSQYEKPKILSSFKQKFPNMLFKSIVFRIG